MLAPAFVRLTGYVYNGLCAVSTDASFKTAINTHNQRANTWDGVGATEAAEIREPGWTNQQRVRLT